MDSIKEALPSEATAAGTSLGTAVIGANKNKQLADSAAQLSC